MTRPDEEEMPVLTNHEAALPPLGDLLSRVRRAPDRIAATWPDGELPTRRHAKSGKDCDAQSNADTTKKVPQTSLDRDVTYELEFCPCGARRQRINGESDRSWIDINCGLDDPNWCTREKAQRPTTAREDKQEDREQHMTPILVRPEPTELVLAGDGLPVQELVNATPDGNAPGAPNSVGWMVLGPGQRTRACRSDSSWTYVIVLQAGRDGLHAEGGTRMDQRRIQYPHQVLVIPPGYPRRLWNPSLTIQVTAIVVRSCPSLFDDQILLPHLDHLGLVRLDDLDDHSGHHTEDGPLLLTPDPDKLVLSAHGLLMHELVNATSDGNAPDSPNSVAWVRLGPGDRTRSHRHENSTAIVVVLETGESGVDTVGGPQMTDRFTQYPGEILVINRDYEHRAENTDLIERVAAIEIRDCRSVHDDRPLLTHLDHLGLDPLGNHHAAAVSHWYAQVPSLVTVRGLR